MTSRVATIIVNWNGRDTTLACVHALLNAGQLENDVFVVDNGSSDGSVDALRDAFPPLHVLEAGSNLGFARANNVGVKFAQAETNPDFIFLLNNDAFVNADTLPQLKNALEKNPTAGATVPKIWYGDGQRLWYAGGSINWRAGTGAHWFQGEPDHGQVDQPRVVEFAPGCALLLRCEAVDTTRLFDERYFFMGEDVDLSLRLTRANHPIFYEPAATVRHAVGASSQRQGQAFIWYHMTRNRLLTIQNHATAAQKLRFLAWWPLLWTIKASLFAARGNFRVAQAMWRGLRDFRAQQFA